MNSSDFFGSQFFQIRPDDNLAPYEIVKLENVKAHKMKLPPDFKIGLFLCHDGSIFPESILGQVKKFNRHDFYRFSRDERDWGSKSLTENLARELNIHEFLSVNVARGALDFNRHPGKSSTEDLFERLSFPPHLAHMSDKETETQLRSFYDPISLELKRVITGCNLLLTIHTYDANEPNHAFRPDISLLTCARSFQRELRLPEGIYTHHFPAERLAAWTADVRLVLLLLSYLRESKSLFADLNVPHSFPTGSSEIRGVVNHFVSKSLEYLKFQVPSLGNSNDFTKASRLLLDTPLRIPEQEKRNLQKTSMMNFLDQVWTQYSNEIIQHYLNPFRRLHCIGIEVKKTLLWQFDKNDEPVGPNEDNISSISTLLAKGIVHAVNKFVLMAKQGNGQF